MAIKQETELYAPLKSFFERQGYDIKGEVRTCDLVGIREDEAPPLIVEMKKSFNLALLLQGIERLRLSPNVYLAVERVREKKGAVNQRWGEAHRAVPPARPRADHRRLLQDEGPARRGARGAGRRAAAGPQRGAPPRALAL